MQWAGLFFIAYGIYVAALVFSYQDALAWIYRGRTVAAILGQKGARIFFAFVAILFIVFGSLVLVGVIRPAHEREALEPKARDAPRPAKAHE